MKPPKSCMTAHPRMRVAGFTLAELLVTMVIMLILASIAYPAYTSFMIKARRAEGQTALLDAMLQQERYYTQHQTYLVFSSASTEPDAKDFRWWSGQVAADSAYEISGRACPGITLERCIELHAEPGTAVVNASFSDPECATLILTSAGHAYATGPKARCWP